VRRMTVKELDQLDQLLGLWFESHPDERTLRDDVSALRLHVQNEADER
jgi:hypothetical protein